jgi:hypothetical protein
MKTIIETSLKFSGVSPNDKTLFDPDNKNKSMRYFNLALKSGKHLRVDYEFEEDGIKQRSYKLMDVPVDLDEAGVKDFIYTQISQ